MTADDLTPEQRTLLERLISGRTTKQLAHELGMHPATLGHRVVRLKNAIGLRTLLQLGYWAAVQGVHPRSVSLVKREAAP